MTQNDNRKDIRALRGLLYSDSSASIVRLLMPQIRRVFSFWTDLGYAFTGDNLISIALTIRSVELSKETRGSNG